MTPIRVLIVDDSPTIRSLIAAKLAADPAITVVGACGDPFEAREAIKALNPDVMTLDVEMPRMSGLEFLDKIMRLRPMPVIMISTLTQAGAAITVEALEIGAVDCVGKPDFSGLVEKIKIAAKARVRLRAPATASSAARTGYRTGDKVLAIGASTGGVEALSTLLATFPANCPPTLITQHMPATFTASFAARLDRLCAARVAEATDGAPLQPGHIYVAPGGATHLTVRGGGGGRCVLVDSDPVNGHRPSVDVLFSSMARTFGARAVGVLLTGMGRDGAEGLLQIRKAGGRTLGQDEASCVVYGMPRAAHEIGAVERQAPITTIGASALDLCAAQLSGAA